MNESMDEDAASDRFDRFGALYIVCSRSHGGQWSRGYRLFSRLTLRGYSPGLSVRNGESESESMSEYIERFQAAADRCPEF